MGDGVSGRPESKKTLIQKRTSCSSFDNIFRSARRDKEGGVAWVTRSIGRQAVASTLAPLLASGLFHSTTSGPAVWTRGQRSVVLAAAMYRQLLRHRVFEGLPGDGAVKLSGRLAPLSPAHMAHEGM